MTLSLLRGYQETRILPLYGVNEAEFFIRNIPWSSIPMGWIGRSIPSIFRNISWMDATGPCGSRCSAEKRVGTAVRFNALPNGAQPFGPLHRRYGYAERWQA